MRLEEWSRKWKSAAAPSRVRWSGAQALAWSQPCSSAKLPAGAAPRSGHVAANCSLVVRRGEKYTRRNMELLDLIQRGHDRSAVRGVEKFRPHRG